ncbi:MAG: class I SAM-dependent methyltransferase [Gammaproteobacteria bacterium]|nr:class I SAM-dependent methyltransferase [Gammaproteobacteria bacterium]MDH3512457.1 class I SAM-dependent methyltransferase [Gammaproteobacteria bacterium]
MTGFKDYFSGVSTSYRDFRPHYPEQLFQHLADIAPSRSIAWDCATGSGQAARLLVRHFDRVIATDASASQIDNAEAVQRITYRVEPAESTGLETDSIDLVTVAQALHWFDLPAFEREVRRVCKRNAVLAVWSYAILQSKPSVDAVIEKLYNGILGDYWTAERRIVDQGYKDVEFPFESLESPPFAMCSKWSLDHMLGYLSTWSAATKYKDRNGKDPVALIADELTHAWGDPQSRLDVSWPLTVRLWRIPA